MKKLIKKIHVIVLSFVLAISNVLLINQANAASVGGWNLGGGVAQGASTVYNGTKNVLINGKDFVKKGVATITPNASQVAKVLGRGVAGYALSVAVEELLGAVDWVLDPSNNQIVYTVTPLYCADGSCEFLWRTETNYDGYKSAQEGCNARDSQFNKSSSIYKNQKTTAQKNSTLYSVKVNSQTVQVNGYTCVGTREKKSDNSIESVSHKVVPYAINPDYSPAEEDKKTLPLDVVAAQVISNAESGDTNAQVATTAAAADIVAEAEKDDAKARPIVQQLENSATTENADADAQADANTATGSQTQNPSKPDTTDLKLEFPAFCGWAPVVCEAAQVVISFPAKVELWVKDLLGIGQKVETNTKETADKTTEVATNTKTIAEELTKEDGIPEKDKTDINLPDLPITPQTVNINWGGNCPAPTTTTISFAGQSREITIMRYDFICEWAWVIKFSVVAMASISAVFIISGRKS